MKKTKSPEVEKQTKIDKLTERLNTVEGEMECLQEEWIEITTELEELEGH